MQLKKEKKNGSSVRQPNVNNVDMARTSGEEKEGMDKRHQMHVVFLSLNLPQSIENGV